MSANKTEQLVRKCFCWLCDGATNRIAEKSCPSWCLFLDYKFIARAARRFVRLENRQKAQEKHQKFLRWCKSSKNPNRNVKLPEHFGEIKVNN